MWQQQLRAARERLGLSRTELADLTGIPEATLRRWEDGSRQPPLPRLRTLFDALAMPQEERHRILRDAGLVMDATLFPLSRFPRYFYSLDELPGVVEQVPWPEFVVNDRTEVVAVNRTTEAIWGIDFKKELARRKRPQLNLLSVASDRKFADRVVNWWEVVALLAGLIKGRPAQSGDLDELDPYLNVVLAEFAQGDPAFLSSLIDIWVKTPARDPKCRWSYPIAWRDPELGDMRFLAVVSTASEPDALSFNDWHPVDAETWAVLEQVKSRAL